MLKLFNSESFVFVALLAGIVAMLLHSYLFFHISVEFFSILIAFSIFVFGWNTRKYFENNYLLTIAIAYLFIGLLDMLHTLAYKGMNIFTSEPNIATQLWIVARFFEAITFVVAYLYMEKKPSEKVLFAGYFIFTALSIWSIFIGIFPDCFVVGTGLTTFKITAEYVIIAILILSFYLLKQSTSMSQQTNSLLKTAIIITIVSEFCFTIYQDVYGIANIIGHILKIISFYLLYKAILNVGLNKPMEFLIQKLEKSQESITIQQGLLIRQSRVSAMGEMVNAIAHHWRQPLNYIGMNVQNLKELYDDNKLDDKRLEEEIEKVMNSLISMSNSINDLMGIFPKQQSIFDYSTLEEIKKCYQPIKAELEYSDIILHINPFGSGYKAPEEAFYFQKDDDKKRAISTEFRQVIFNILLNSRDTIIIKRAKNSLDEQGHIWIDLSFENGYEKIVIEDNGGGVDEKSLSRAFEPFYTTKERGSGKGIITGVGTGLYIAKIVIEEHMKGSISLENGKNGAKIIITIPL